MRATRKNCNFASFFFFFRRKNANEKAPCRFAANHSRGTIFFCAFINRTHFSRSYSLTQGRWVQKNECEEKKNENVAKIKGRTEQ